MVKEKYVEYSKAKNKPVSEMTPAQVKLATMPEKTEPIENPVGTAPGIRVEIDGTALFALPGVPSEMEAIFKQSIAPIIKQTVGDVVFCEKSIFVNEMMESTLAPLIDKVMSDNAGVYIKSHPLGEENKPHIEIHLTLRAQSQDKPSEKILKAQNELIIIIQQTRQKAAL
jgi:molybdopterin-biosynthesis enzyme MoeA-like protein